MPTRVISSDNYADFLAELRALADEKYRRFHSGLVPGEESVCILGVRMPVLRALGKELAAGEPRQFLSVCGDTFYEERMLRAIVTGLIKPKDYEDFLALADGYLPYVSNWALCDCFCSGLKAVRRWKAPFFEHIAEYLEGDIWAQRVGLVLMLDYYLDDEYIDRVLARVDAVHSEAYYVRMAQAWLLATALAKCPEPSLAYYRGNSLDDFTHNKAVQKALESFRIDEETKNILRALKRS